METVEEIVALAQKEEIVEIEWAVWNTLTLEQKAMGLGELSRLIGIGMLPVLLSVLLSARLKLDINANSFYVRFDQIFVAYA